MKRQKIPVFEYPLNIVISNRPSNVLAQDNNGVMQRLRRLFNEFEEDYEAHINLSIVFSELQDDQVIAGEVYSVYINDVRCRVNHMIANQLADQSVYLADTIFSTIYDNRTLLITGDLIEAVAQFLASESDFDVSNEIVGHTLRDALQRCFSIRQAVEVCRIAIAGGANLDYRIELYYDNFYENRIVIELGRTIYDEAMKIEETNGSEQMHTVDSSIKLMRDGLFYELGIRVPNVKFVYGETLDELEFRMRFNHLRGPVHKSISIDKALVNDTVDRLTLLNIIAEECINPANFKYHAMVSVKDAEVCENAGLTVWKMADFMILTFSAEIRRLARVLYTLSQVEYSLYQLDQAFPMVVFNTLERYSMSMLAKVLRDLVAEEINLRDLRNILEAMLQINGSFQVNYNEYIVFTAGTAHYVNADNKVQLASVPEVVEFVRAALKRSISHKYTRGGSTLVVYLLDPEIEKRLLEYKELDESERRLLVTAVNSEHDLMIESGQAPVILTTSDVRARLRRELVVEFPSLAVLSYQELSYDLNIQPIARISWDFN